jgi:hypothetical protein
VKTCLTRAAAHVDDSLFRLELSFEQGFDVVGQLVDDVVAADFDLPLVGQIAGRFVGNDVEADDDRVGRASPASRRPP